MSVTVVRHPTLKVSALARIKLGTYPSPVALRDAVIASGGVHASAVKVMNKPEFTTSDRERKVELYRVPIALFTFGRDEFVHGSMVHSRSILKHGERHGFDATVAEVAPQLWRQRPDVFASFSKREWVQFAMEPIDNMAFNVVSDGGPPFLTAAWGEGVQPLTEQYIFAKYI